MATQDQVVGLVKSAVAGDQSYGRKLAEQIREEARRAGQKMLADKLDKILGSSAQVAKLQESTSDLIWWETSDRSLDSIELTAENKATVKSLIRENIYSKHLIAADIEPRRKVMLDGPSGTGKTSLAKAIANELKRPFGVVRISGLIGSYVGETEKALNKIWEGLQRPCVVLFDEWDAVAAKRSNGFGDSASKSANRAVCTLLTLIERLPFEAVLVAATNVPEQCDDAFVRRFDVRMTLGLPSPEELRRFANNIALKWPDLVLPLFEGTLGHSFATAENAVLDAAREAVLKRVAG